VPRPYHSPSSIATGQACPRKWALRYIAGLREPETPAQAFGKGGHSTLEGHYEGREVDWTTPAGRVVHAGLHLLPAPDRCELIEVEHGIGRVPLPPSHAHGSERKPTTALLVHGVKFGGFRDLLVQPTWAEALRIGVTPGVPTTHDWKFTSSIGQYALTPESLARDVQASTYALDACERFKHRAHWVRWVYFQRKGARRTLPIVACITRDQALDVLEKPAALARELDTLERVEDAPQNPRACGDYGGCKYHVQAGGPCDARRSIGALIQARVIRKDPRIMALTEEQKAKFNKAKAGAATPAPAEDAATDAPEVTTDLRPPVARRGRKPNPRSAPAPVEDVAPPAAETQAQTIASLAARLAELEAEHAATLAKIREVAAA
jgi:hypothetical protein